MAEESEESFLDTLKSAIKTSSATAKARAAGNWFREKVKQASASAQMRAVTPAQLLKRQEDSSAVLGKMLFYKYDLNYLIFGVAFLNLPLVFPFEKAKGGFYGLNLHYIPPRDRAALMDELKAYATNNKYDATTRLKITYDLLKGFGRAVPCVKRYLGTNVRSNTVRINADEWEIAIFLPVERFQKQKKSVVWNDSREYY